MGRVFEYEYPGSGSNAERGLVATTGRQPYPDPRVRPVRLERSLIGVGLR